MPKERLSMRKIKELLRLKFESGLSIRQISTSLRLGVGSVHEYLSRVRVAGLSWPLPEGLTEEQLEERLFPPTVTRSADARPLPNWKQLDTEIKRKGVTLRLLWEEHRTANPQVSTSNSPIERSERRQTPPHRLLTQWAKCEYRKGPK